MSAHLILRLDAPLMAFGDTMIDATGPTRDLPIASSLTGLIANALGWPRLEKRAHQRLQDRLIMGARLDRVGAELRDFQTAQLAKADEGWTTRGAPEGRAGGSATYRSPHIRERYYRADALVTVAMRLEPVGDEPTLADVCAALEHPARPLFIGRKPCLPSGPILASPVPIEAETVLAALLAWPLEPSAKGARSITMVLPPQENRPERPHRAIPLADRRNWISGVHAGESALHVLAVAPSEFPPASAEVAA